MCGWVGSYMGVENLAKKSRVWCIQETDACSHTCDGEKTVRA